MPQLNPAPWFMILILTWIILLVMMTPKVLAHLSPNNPSPSATEKAKTEPWHWTWH
uniref:ATP synthase complex subunit 8 n=2 Tax=Percilia TaxID=270587 RepID=A0A077LBA6_9TELE|nr:ATP synthase F0 subunit 8 [Percilia irwini]QHD18588.1 ATPase subunit 8 [Percilia gillissi]QHD18601.1 ATPase subunit 8 [Percilia irwini]BAP40353.1 ATPase subunit 8 [Percilia irwini]BBU25804.1 ATPase subunit 8 [Percilia irwini]